MTGTPPRSWCQVLEEEYEALYGRPALETDEPGDPSLRLHRVHERFHAKSPAALCLSGGGIRSATFGLGVLQGLAHAGVLGTLDYLSTVSGGGYIGGWFTAWLHRQGADGRADVLQSLDPADAAVETDDSIAASPVERVRRTCRYLAPQGGVVSADVWALVTTMGRNLLLNWLVILPLIAVALLVPHVYYAIVHAVEQETVRTTGCLAINEPSIWFLAVAIAGAAMATTYGAVNFAGIGGGWSQGRFLLLFLTPALVSAVSATLFWSAYPCELNLRTAVVLSASIPAAAWLIIGATARLVRRGAPTPRDGSTLRMRIGGSTVWAALVAGPILGAGAYWFATYPFGFGHGLREFYAAFAVPIVLGLALLSMVVFIGLVSRDLDDAALEWWSRCGGWLAIAATLWMSAGVLIFYMADLIEAGVRAASNSLPIDHGTTSVGFGVLIPLVSSLAGMAARAGGQTGRPSFVRLAFQRVALPLIIFVLLSTIAWANLRLTEVLEYHRVGGTLCTPAMAGSDADGPCHPLGAGLGEVLMLGAGLLALGLVMSRFVPVNRFSLNGMYRERLIRTFLGASRQDRRPNAFTGFDAHDDLRVDDLRDVRPLHVINATLNAVSSTHVDRHEKEAESFTFTPLSVGNRFVKYRRACEYGSDGGGKATGLSLGMALAVSGAAASPAMGMYSTHSRAFLLTLANARLGLWFGNPQSETTWQRSEPPFSVAPLMRELLGLTTDHDPYVYLSDGGHYENLGLWEMVARRCRFIIVSDAGCDPDYTFADLSNAIRRIRLDLGIPIEFPPLPMSKAGQGHGNQHAALGTIRYSIVDGPAAPDGTILYIKATLSGDEPVDVVNYSRSDTAFPHDSTADQFFDEARFESYRMLGFHSVESIAAELTAMRGGSWGSRGSAGSVGSGSLGSGSVDSSSLDADSVRSRPAGSATP